MSKITVYMEGGGDSHSRGLLRKGMKSFFKELGDLANKKSWGWDLICCGGRQEAFEKFTKGCMDEENALVVLLVDSEAPVTNDPCAHLAKTDGWKFDNIPEDNVHLMIQIMETWIIADHSALKKFYGQEFQPNRLPTSDNLENVAKGEVNRSLRLATEKTQKGSYHKIHHSNELLKIIDPKIVRRKCPSCERFFTIMGRVIERE